MSLDTSTQRQQVLFLYLEHSGLQGHVVGWSFLDGSGQIKDLPPSKGAGSPPYRTGVDALVDGWRLLQVSPVPARTPGAERVTGRLEHEAVFERIVPLG